ncbi:IS3 family transposase [Streptomyces sp. NPDC020707]|uniref:IS3 family transposase n=1 Tax=Streptomyces sp. NPDC020707 TaxID=3365084 RepID=UPI00378DB947
MYRVSNEVLRTASAFFAAQLDPTRPQVTALVDESPHLGVECVPRELSIASFTYYRWRRAGHEPCECRRRDAELAERTEEIHADSGGIYGSSRVHAVLRREDVHVDHKRVERLMREAEIARIGPRRGGFTCRGPKATLAPDLIERDFNAPAPNRLWAWTKLCFALPKGRKGARSGTYRCRTACLGPSSSTCSGSLRRRT